MRPNSRPDPRRDPRLTRLIACLVAAGLIASPAAWAQPAYRPSQPLAPQLPAAPLPPAPPAVAAPAAPPSSAGPAAGAASSSAPASAEVSPPLRVGRVAQVQGSVSFHTGGATQWVAATLNYPVTSQDAFWTQPGGQGAIEISDSRMVMNAETELDLGTIDGTQVAATVPRGEVFVELRQLAAGESWTLQTPRGAVRLGGDGRYGITAGDTEHPTVVTVLAGTAVVTVSDGSAGLQAPAGQAVAISGTDHFIGQVVPAQPDAFLQALAAQAPPPPVNLPPMVARMPGCTQLAAYGNWQTSPDYGTVWYPRVASGWVPYREGHWAYVAPWGWTWIDAAPWGFAPFHYGRWAEVNGAWAWVPGQYAAEQAPQPVYAPALVAFVGPDGGALAGAAVAGFAAGALAGGAIGWLPLGPREPYYPWFHARPDWVRDVNVGHVGDPAAVVAGYRRGEYGLAPGRLVNRGAGTLVPAAAMLGSQPVGGIGHPLPAAELGRFQPVFGREPLRPGASTSGLTPAVAAQLGIAGGPPRLAAPGPALPPPSAPLIAPAARGVALPLAVAGRPAGAPEHAGPPLSGFAGRPGAPLAPAPGTAAAPGPGRPALAPPAGMVTSVPAAPGGLPERRGPVGPAAPGFVRPPAPMPAVQRPVERTPEVARPGAPQVPAVVSRPAAPQRPAAPPHFNPPPRPPQSAAVATPRPLPPAAVPHAAAAPPAPHFAPPPPAPHVAPPPPQRVAAPSPAAHAAPPPPRQPGGRDPHRPG